MSETVRKPQQQRSIDKRNKIIQAGYELFAQNGYFNTNTAEIAKSAGVSTGLVYGYFRDKRDILVEVLDQYIQQVYEPILQIFDSLTAPLKFNALIPQIVEQAIAVHKKNSSIHEALHALSHTDDIVNKKFIQLEDTMTKKFVERLNVLNYHKSNLHERVHLAMNLIQSYAHEYVFDKHSYINYQEMKNIVVCILTQLFEQG